LKTLYIFAVKPVFEKLDNNHITGGAACVIWRYISFTYLLTYLYLLHVTAWANLKLCSVHEITAWHFYPKGTDLRDSAFIGLLCIKSFISYSGCGLQRPVLDATTQPNSETVGLDSD